MLSCLLVMALVAFASGGGSRASAKDWGHYVIESDAGLATHSLLPVVAPPSKSQAQQVAVVPLHFTAASGPAAVKPLVAVERVALGCVDRLRTWRFSAAPGRGPPQVS